MHTWPAPYPPCARVMVVWCFLLLWASDGSQALTALKIGGIFPISADQGGWAGGQGCLPAAKLALDDVNNKTANPDLLPDYRLELTYHDSRCQPGLGAKAMYDLLYKDKTNTKVMLLTGCSLVTTVVAEAAIMWNLIVLAYGASSPALSNRERFPTLFRTHPSATIHNPTRVALLKKFKWKKIAILQSAEELFETTAKDLERECQEAGISIISRQSFLGNPSDAIESLKRHDARIIVGLFYEKEARRVFCELYKKQLYGRRYVWFLIGWYPDTWFENMEKEEKIDCTKQQMREAVQYHFTTEASMLSDDKRPGISGMTGEKFTVALDRALRDEGQTKENTTGYVEAPLAYDAIWALALALNCTVDRLAGENKLLEDFTYTNSDYTKYLFNCMRNTKFRGVSGKVTFTDTGDRIAKTQIEQMQDGKYVIMGYFDGLVPDVNKKLDWHGNEKFEGSKGAPPDSTITQEHLLTVSVGLYGVVCFASTVGVLCTGAAVFFNWKFSHRRHIQQSQPQCNNIMLVGCILCFVSLFLFGLPSDGLVIPKHSFSLLCHARVTVLLFGFTLAYGSMFAKVWIVHRMGASEHQEFASAKEQSSAESESETKPMLPKRAKRAKSNTHTSMRTILSMGGDAVEKIRKFSSTAYMSVIGRKVLNAMNQPIPAWKFYSVVLVFLIVDSILVCIWIMIDPMKRKKTAFPAREQKNDRMDEDVLLIPTLELCQSKHQDVWIGIIFGFKGLLLVFGLFLAYESRNLKLRYVNDSRFVSLAIYNVAVLSLITGPVVVLLIRTQENANFAFVSATVLLCVFISMGLLFVPKILYVWHVPPTSKEEGSASTTTNRKLTKAEQERCKQLTIENEKIKKQIEMKELRIAELRARLARRMEQVGENQTLSHRHTSSDNNTGDSETRASTVVTTRASVEPMPNTDETTPKRSIREESSGYKSMPSGGAPNHTLATTAEEQTFQRSDHADVIL